MFRRFVCLAFVMLLCTSQPRVIAQSYPKAHAYFAPQPDYPYLARVNHIEASGVFTVQIDPRTGLVTSLSGKKITGWATLDKAAINALRRWSFATRTKPSV